VQAESGETFSVTDKKEAWVFHMSPDDTGASAVWVAQRVPDDHIAVVANGFTIRYISPLLSSPLRDLFTWHSASFS
jgi:dipeptidase